MTRIGLIILVVVGSALAAASPAGAVFPGGNGNMVLSSVQFSLAGSEADPEPGHVWLFARGRKALRLPTFIHRSASVATFSPNGLRLLSYSERGLTVSRPDGSRRRLLVRTPQPDTPVWSPKGGAIAFNGPRSIKVVRSDGSGERQLFRQADPYLEIGGIAWSPSGRQLAVTIEGSGQTDERVVVVGMNGQSRELADGSYVSWTRAGIAYRRGTGLYITPSDGSGERIIVDGLGDVDTTFGYWYNQCPADYAWSPDGRRLAFVRDKQLFVGNNDGQGAKAVVLTGGDYCRGGVSFSPDGRQLATLTEGVNIVSVSRGLLRRIQIPYDGECDCDEWVGTFDWQALPRRR